MREGRARPSLGRFYTRLFQRFPMDKPYGVDPVAVAGVVLTLVVVPLLAGIVFGWLWPRAAERIREPAPRIASVVTLVKWQRRWAAVAAPAAP